MFVPITKRIAESALRRRLAGGVSAAALGLGIAFAGPAPAQTLFVQAAASDIASSANFATPTSGLNAGFVRPVSRFVSSGACPPGQGTGLDCLRTGWPIIFDETTPVAVPPLTIDFTLGDGDDTFLVDDATAAFDGIDAGDGFDTLIVDRTLDFTLALDGLLNFESYNKLGSGALTATGVLEDAVFFLDDGLFHLTESGVIAGVAVLGGDLVNDGVIRAAPGLLAVAFDSAAIGSSLTNSGRINGETALDSFADGFTLENTTDGELLGNETAVRLAGADLTITNAGLIASQGARFEAVMEISSTGQSSLTNTGGVLGALGAPVDGVRALVIDILDGEFVLQNDGAIAALGEDAQAVAVSVEEGIFRFTNGDFGQVLVSGEGSIGVRVSQTTGTMITPPRALGQITNSGAIIAEGEGSTGVAIFSEAEQITAINNSGEIVGASVGLLGGDGREWVTNSGGIFGADAAVDLRAGDDRFILTGGGLFGAPGGAEGLIDGGEGLDQFGVDLAEGDFTRIDGAWVRNFEFLTKTGLGELTLAGDWDGRLWTTTGGTLLVESDSTVGGVVSRGGRLTNRGVINTSGLASNQEAVFVQADALVDTSVLNESLIDGGLRVFGDGAVLTNTIDGVIQSDRSGAVIIGDSNVLTNDGVVVTRGGELEAGVLVVGDNNTITNSGAVLAGFTPDGEPVDLAVGVRLTGDYNRLLNSGDVRAFGMGAVGVAASGRGVRVFNLGGAIEVEGRSAEGVRFGHYDGQTSGLLGNSGQIIARGEGAIGVNLFGGSLMNNGEIVADFAGVVGGHGDNSVTVQNGSVLAGMFAIALQDGDDRLVVSGDSTIAGLDGTTAIADGGEGFDQFLVSAEQGQTVTLDVHLTNFELQQKDGAGELWLTGGSTDADWLVNDGIFRIGAAASTGAVILTDGVVEVLNYGQAASIVGADGQYIVSNYGHIAAGEGDWSVGLAGDGIVLNNFGTISTFANADDREGVYLVGDGARVTNQGQIFGDRSLRVEGDAFALVNGREGQGDGTLGGTFGAANLLEEVEGIIFSTEIIGDEAQIANHGFLALASIEGANSTIANFGVLGGEFARSELPFGPGLVVLTTLGDDHSVLNDGTIMAFHNRIDGVGVRFAGLNNLLINSGRPDGIVDFTQPDAFFREFRGIAAFGTGVLVSAGASCDGDACAQGKVHLASIINEGDIVGFEGGEGTGLGIDVLSNAGQTFSLVNGETGVIYGHLLAIRGGDGSEDVVLRDGSLTDSFGSRTIDLGGGDDALTVHAGAEITGISDGGSGLDTLSFIAGDQAWGVDISQFVNWELLELFGDVYLFGEGAFGLITVAEGGLLGGASTLNGDLLINGTLAPGNSLGTITVNGAVTFADTGVYAAEVTPDARSDQLVVDGSLNLGGTLAVDPFGPESAYSVRTRYTLFTAAGAVDGQFADITVGGAFDPYLTVVGGEGRLTLVRQIDFRSDATSANARAGAGGLNSRLDPDMDQQLVDVMDAVLTLNGQGRAAALDDLSGDIYATQVLSNLFAHRGFAGRSARSFREGLMTSGAWLEGVSAQTRFDAEPGVRGLTEDRSGVFGGYDWAGDAQSAGLSFAYLQSDGSADFVDSQTKGYGLGAHAATTLGGFDLGLSASWMTHSSQVRRGLRLAWASRTAAGEMEATTWLAGAAIARSFQTIGLGGAVLRPAVRVDYAAVNADAFTETAGGAAALEVEANDFESLQTALGAAMIWGGGDPAARFGAALQADFVIEHGDDTASTRTRFGGQGDAFGIESLTLASERLELGARVDGQFGPVQLSAGYDVRLSQNVSDHRAVLAARMPF